MYVVQPSTVHVAAVFTADVIVAVTVTLWFASFAQTLVAVHDLPSVAKLYVTVQSCPNAEPASVTVSVTSQRSHFAVFVPSSVHVASLFDL